MSLASDPSVTFNAEGNIQAITTTLAGGANVTTPFVDYSVNSLGGWVQVYGKGGATVGTTNGVQVAVYPQGSLTSVDSVPMWTFSFALTASTVTRASILLPTGRFAVLLVNLDPTNSINVGLTSNPIA